MSNGPRYAAQAGLPVLLKRLGVSGQGFAIGR